MAWFDQESAVRVHSSTPHPRLDRADAAEELSHVAAALYARGWCPGGSGSLSVALQDDPVRVLISSARADKSRLSPECLVLVGADGRALQGELLPPSGDSLLHTTIATLTQDRAVLHTQSVWGLLLGNHYAVEGGFTVSGYEALEGLAGIEDQREELFVPVLVNNRDPHVLADHAKELLAEWPSANGFVVANRGLYTWGAALADARRHVEIFEFVLECLGRRLGLPGERPTASEG
jgi:methylthioribulose-1-phosphate dehydratase